MMTTEPDTRPIGRRALRGPRVGDVLAWPGFDVRLATGDIGIDRVIRLAHATELVDPSAFLRGGELIMTVGSELSDDDHCERFVAALMRSGASGIALALGVEGHTPPAGLVLAAERAGIAVLEVPPSLPFVAFTETLQRLSEERGQIERERREDGRMLDFVRRGMASPHVFRDRFPDAVGREYAVLCLPDRVEIVLGGVLVEGWLDEMLVLVVEEPYATAFQGSDQSSLYAAGGPVPLSNLARSLKEAFAAFALAARRGGPAGPRDLATLSGLLERLTADQFAPFRDHIIEPLRRHDARHTGVLLETLTVYIDAGAGVSETAARLGVHPNSVRNRLARVREVTGLDPTGFDDRVALTIAVRNARSG